MGNKRRVINAGDPERSYVDLDVHEPVAFISVVSASKKKATRRRRKTLLSDDLDISERAIKIEIKAKSKHASKLELVLYNEDLALNDSPITQKGNIIKIRWGYSGYMGRTRKFRIKRIKGTRARVKSVGQLTVIAYSQEADLGNVSMSMTYRYFTANDLVKLIAKRHGLSEEDLRIDPSQKAEIEIIHQVNQTDQAFLASLSQKLGWVFSLDDGILTFAPHGFLTNFCKPIAVWTYFTDPKGWVKRFEPEGNILSEVGSVTVKSRDPVTGKKVKSTATIRTRAGRSLGKYVPVKPGDSGGQSLVSQGRKIHRGNSVSKPGVLPSGETINRPGATAKQVKKEAQTRLNNRHKNLFKARALNVGDPLIWKDQIVRFNNVGDEYSGNWIVSECRHVLDANGYDMELILRKNATDSLGGGRRPGTEQTTKTQFASRRQAYLLERRMVETDYSRLGTRKRTRFSRQ